MTHAEKFYPKLHSKDDQYSAGEYRIDTLVNLRVFRQWMEPRKGKPLHVADIGCGKARFLRDFTNDVRKRWNVPAVHGSGTDLVRSRGDHFAEIDPNFRFIEHNLDGQKLPFADSEFDFLCCNQVLEHIFETEALVREFRRVLRKDGLCVISVPNTSAWINRFTFLFAGQPLGSELGTEEITYGFWPANFQPRLQKFKPSGHIRDFTPRGLRDLCRHCGFETVGWWKQSFGLIARMSNWSGRGLAIVLKPTP
jgi:ubiquinone/menaquinone biosynthesis C-methylase UbiE